MHVPNHQLDIVVVHELFPPGFMAGIFEVKTMDFPAAKPTHSIQIELNSIPWTRHSYLLISQIPRFWGYDYIHKHGLVKFHISGLFLLRIKLAIYTQIVHPCQSPFFMAKLPKFAVNPCWSPPFFACFLPSNPSGWPSFQSKLGNGRCAQLHQEPMRTADCEREWTGIPVN